MELQAGAEKLISLLTGAGFEAYAVGGCVRDFLLGRPCDDIDITTSATPFEVERVLDENGIKYFETGLKHGTVTALVEGVSFEVTTFRKDGEYFDSRHPESVSFVRDIRFDLSRRDFTMNAIAYNGEKGYVDLFRGVDDINNKLIRAVGDANKRFNEDALRIMRAIRFSSQLGFEIEKGTKEAVFRNKELLKNISSERLFTELKKLLMGDYACEVLLEYREVIAVFIPEITPCFDFPQNNSWHIYDVWEHICHSVRAGEKIPEVRLALLFHDIGKPHCKTTDSRGDHFYGHPEISAELCRDILKRLRASNELLNTVETLVRYHDIRLKDNKKQIRKWLSKLGEEVLRLQLKVRRADMLAQNPDKTGEELGGLYRLELLLDDVINEKEPYAVSDLAVNGFDLINIGFRGRAIGDMLQTLIALVIDEKLCNTKEELLNFASSHKTDF